MTWLIEPTGDNEQVEKTASFPCGWLGPIAICLGVQMLCANLCLCNSIPPDNQKGV